MLIAVVWAVPTFYGMLSMTNWNCTALCTCTLSYKDPNHHICQANDNSTRSTCSNIYTPMAKSYLFVVVVMWLLECFVLIALFSNSLYQISKSDKVSVNVTQSPKCMISASLSRIEKKMNNSTLRRKSSLGRTLSKYRNSHQLLMTLFSLFFVCTAPIMTCFAIDYLSAENVFFSPMLVNVLTPLPFIYCLLSPVLFLRRLGGVRSAVSMMLTIKLSKRRSPVARSNTSRSCVDQKKFQVVSFQNDTISDS